MTSSLTLVRGRYRTVVASPDGGSRVFFGHSALEAQWKANLFAKGGAGTLGQVDEDLVAAPSYCGRCARSMNKDTMGPDGLMHNRACPVLSGLAAHAPIAVAMLGDDPPAPLVWTEVAPSNGSFTFIKGQRYAVLASVSKNFTLDQVQRYMTSNGWTVTYAWEQAAPTRGLYPIDAWLAALPADTTDNHRWVYGEADRTGDDWTKGQDAPWPLTLYHIAHVLQATPAPAGTTPAPLPTSSSSTPAPSRTGAFVGGVATGAGVVLLWRLASRWLLR